MPNQTIAITLNWGPVSTDFSAANINQLGELIAAQLSASVRADITFIPIVTNDPTAFDGQLIFNVAQNIFKSWNIGTGSYRAITEYAIGDIKNTFVGTDTISTGWVILNGRTLASITGLTGAQLSALQALFPSGSLPSVTPANVSGLPAGNAFGDIPWPPSIEPTVQPAAGVISPGLTFTNPVTDTEGQALADQTEILRNSVQDSFYVTKQIQTVAQQLLTALNNANPPVLYAAVFCGYA